MSKTDKIKTALLLALAAVSLGALAAFLGMQYTLAAYAQSYVKGVAATGSIGTQLISSNLLYGYRSGNETIGANTLSMNADSAPSGNLSVTVTVSNYMQNYMSLHNSYDVKYTLSVTAQSPTGDEIDFTRCSVKAIAPAEDNGGSLDGNGTYKFLKKTLTGLAAATHSYTITFPAEYLNKISFTVKAALAEASSGYNNTGYAMLAATLVPTQKKQQAKSLNGQLINDAKPDDTAYTYEITLNGDNTYAKLTWPEGLEIDPWIYYSPTGETNYVDVNRYNAEKEAFATIDDDNRTAKFEMQPGAIVVNFYRKNSAQLTEEDLAKIQVTEDEEAKNAKKR